MERLDHFFEANEVADVDKKRAILLTVIGPSAYKLLRNLLAPAKPKDKTYTELVGILKEHYSPKPSETVQRFRFNSRFRQPEESVSTFVSELRSLAEFCNFGTALDDMLRDRLVCGINDSAIQRKLLSERNLTFDKALEMAQSHEAAVRNARTLQAGTNDVSEPVHTLQKFRQSNDGSGSDPCYRCGRHGHAPTRCRFRSFKCHQCGRIGHIKAVCRSSSQGEKASSQTRARRDVKKLEEASKENEYVQKSEEAAEEIEYTLFNLYAHIDSQSPYLVTLQVDGVPLQMEIDTGSSLSLISESTFRQLWPNKTWEDSKTNLTMYSGAQLQVLGTVNVQVCQASARPVNLSLAVVGADGPSLLGRNWIQSLQLDWPRICRLDAKPAEAVLQ